MLVASLNFEPPAMVPLQLQVPAIRRLVPRQRPPLNLDAAIYRYRIERIEPNESVSGEGRDRFGKELPFAARFDADHRVVVIDEPAGGRFCYTTRRRHRR